MSASPSSSSCSLCAGRATASPVTRSAARNSGARRSHCVDFRVSSKGKGIGRPSPTSAAAPHCGDGSVLARRGISAEYGWAVIGVAGEPRAAVRWNISLASPSRKNALRRRLCCRADSKEGGERSLSERFREIASDSAEAGVRDTSSSRSLSSQLPSRSERSMPVNLVAGAGVTAAVLMMAVLGFIAKPRTNGGGSVSELIKRGQLRSDRGGKESKNLLYDDPFNNPLVKMGSKNPIVRMCGKMFRLTPITLTAEKVTEHQNRRIQAYKWKRPTVFLNEGDPVPEGVDTEEVRWIPSNHPFATTSNFIDEDTAQQNVYQTRGVPSRVRAEHQALRKKILETAQREPEFQLPNVESSGAQAWAPPGESSESHLRLPRDDGNGLDPNRPFGKEVNGSGGNPSGSEVSHDGTSNHPPSQSRYRSIDT